MTRHRKSKHGYKPAPRAPRAKAPKTARVSRFKPYTRVVPSSTLKVTVKTEQLDEPLVGGSGSASQSSSSSGFSAAPIYAAETNIFSEEASSSTKESYLPTGFAAQQFAQAPYVFNPTDIFGMAPIALQDAYPTAETFSAPSGASYDDFSSLMGTFDMDTFSASLNGTAPVAAAAPLCADFFSEMAPVSTESWNSYIPQADVPAQQWADNNNLNFLPSSSPTDSLFSEPSSPSSDILNFEASPFDTLFLASTSAFDTSYVPPSENASALGLTLGFPVSCL